MYNYTVNICCYCREMWLVWLSLCKGFLTVVYIIHPVEVLVEAAK